MLHGCDKNVLARIPDGGRGPPCDIRPAALAVHGCRPRADADYDYNCLF